jgi:hypothetical protein
MAKLMTQKAIVLQLQSCLQRTGFGALTCSGDWRMMIFYYYCIFTIYSRYIKRVISKRDGCVYLKQVPSSDGSLEII